MQFLCFAFTIVHTLTYVGASQTLSDPSFDLCRHQASVNVSACKVEAQVVSGEGGLNPTHRVLSAVVT